MQVCVCRVGAKGDDHAWKGEERETTGGGEECLISRDYVIHRIGEIVRPWRRLVRPGSTSQNTARAATRRVDAILENADRKKEREMWE